MSSGLGSRTVGLRLMSRPVGLRLMSRTVSLGLLPEGGETFCARQVLISNLMSSGEARGKQRGQEEKAEGLHGQDEARFPANLRHDLSAEAP